MLEWETDSLLGRGEQLRLSTQGGVRLAPRERGKEHNTRGQSMQRRDATRVSSTASCRASAPFCR